MTPSEFNSRLREIFNLFISDGFVRSDVSAATFGCNRQDQLQQFLSGRDIGLKPLTTIFESLDFEFHIVPILKNNIEEKELLYTLAENTLETLRWMLLDHLENIKNKKKNTKSGIAIVVDNVINELREIKEN